LLKKTAIPSIFSWTGEPRKPPTKRSAPEVEVDNEPEEPQVDVLLLDHSYSINESEPELSEAHEEHFEGNAMIDSSDSFQHEF
jgi:hypothetical protein